MRNFCFSKNLVIQLKHQEETEMEIMEQFLNKQIAEAKKEIDRLTTRREEELGNSINFIENEVQIERLLAQVEAYEAVLGQL